MNEASCPLSCCIVYPQVDDRLQSASTGRGASTVYRWAMATIPRPVRPPNCALQALEAAWLPVEAAGFWAMRPLLRRMGAGDQHPVLLLPGFGTNDESTAPLR